MRFLNLNYLSFICLIKLCNSFTLFKQLNPIIYSRQCIYKLNMGCDYYIDKNLNIYDYNNNLLSFINLKHNRGYISYYSIFDEDEDEYNNDILENIKRQLEPDMKPIEIYSNNKFNKVSFEKKYKFLIECELNTWNKKWEDVNIIIKTEERYER